MTDEQRIAALQVLSAESRAKHAEELLDDVHTEAIRIIREVAAERDAAVARAERAERIEEAWRPVMRAVRDYEPADRYAMKFGALSPAARAAIDDPSSPAPAEPLYPCRRCGVMRTKAEGGTTFTVCDACWYATSPARERQARAERDGTSPAASPAPAETPAPVEPAAVPALGAVTSATPPAATTAGASAAGEKPGALPEAVAWRWISTCGATRYDSVKPYAEAEPLFSAATVRELQAKLTEEIGYRDVQWDKRKTAEAEVARLTADLATACGWIGDVAEAHGMLRHASAENVRSRARDLYADVKRLVGENATLSATVDERDAAIEKLTTDLARVTAERDELDDRLRDTAAKLEMAENEIDAARRSLVDTRENARLYIRERDTAEAEARYRHEDALRLTAEVARLTAESAKLVETGQGLLGKLSEAYATEEKLTADLARVTAERDEARALIHRDRTGLASALSGIRAALNGWSWLADEDGWASYSYEERTIATLRRELSGLLRECGDIAERALRESGTRANRAFHPMQADPIRDQDAMRAALDTAIRERDEARAAHLSAERECEKLRGQIAARGEGQEPYAWLVKVTSAEGK